MKRKKEGSRHSGYSDIYRRFSKRVKFGVVQQFSKGKKTPFLILDLKRVGANYDNLRRDMPYADIFYAVKANLILMFCGCLPGKALILMWLQFMNLISCLKSE